MKKSILFLSCVLLAGAGMTQSFNLRLNLAYSVFVAGEPLLVRIDLSSQAREELFLGVADATSTLFIELCRSGSHVPLEPCNSAPLIKPVQLSSGQSMQRTLALDKWFNLEQEGRYVVKAVLIHANKRYETVQKSFDIVPGLNLGGGSQMFSASERLQRRFKLVHWYRNEATRLFLRIEDQPDGRVWDTIDLGAFMRGSAPKLDIAPDGVVTVLHRATQDGFIRTVFWSLPEAVELHERNSLVDPEISASQRVTELYGEGLEDESERRQRNWFKFWRSDKR